MKHRLFSRSIALLVVFGLLLTGTLLPVSATDNSNIVNSSSNLILDDDLFKDDNLINSEKVILRAEDPEISEESMILKYVDSSQFNAARHVQRLTELEDLNTYVFANADGTRSIYIMHENVKYVDENGTVIEKDISLKSKTGGFGIVQSNVGLLIPNNPVQGINLEYSGFAIKLIPQGLTNTVSATQSDNSVVYDKAYGENTKLIYTPMLSGVKEDIVLSEYTANATYAFILETDGLTVYRDDNGYYLAHDAKAEPIFFLGNILIYDAVGKPAVGTLTVKTLTDSQKYLLTVTANDDFLSDHSTVYPVTIDPSITVSDSTTSGSIIDAPIFERFPAKNHGDYVYNRVGTPSESYGIGRTVVKLSGLTSSAEYQTIAASQITNVTFYAKESSGGNTQFINLYPLTSNTTWTEYTVTWNNVGSFDTSVNYGNTMYSNQWTAFNITNLVKGWKNGTYSAEAGFIMTNENEANNKSFCASEYSTASYRPYVTMTYETAVSLNYSSTSIVEGGTKTLTATTKPSGQAVTWSTSNSSIATVSASGVVTAKKAGSVTITASMVDADGNAKYAYCTVYVYLPNGVYYFNNVSNNNRIEFVDDSCYAENDPLTVWESDGLEPSERFRLFKLSYLGSGLYSIRSMLDNTMGWTRSGTQLLSTTIGTSDASVPTTARWYIKHNSNGYYIYSQYGTSRTITCPADIDANWNILLSSYSSTNAMQCWDIEKINTSYRGIDIYDKKTSMSINDTYTFAAHTYSTYDGEYSLDIRWETGNSRIASVGSTSGLVSARNCGEISITAYMYNYPSVETTVSLTVMPRSTQTSGIKSGSVYMIKNVSKNKYLKATSTNNLTLANQDEMDGKQLWYVEWTGSAYKLYSMGIKATLPGSSESLMVGNTASNSPKVSTQTAIANWSISYYNGYYYIVNASVLFEDTSLSANSSNDNVRHVSLESETNFARWEFEEIDTDTFNNYYPGDYVGQDSHVYIKISADSSLYVNNYVGTTNMNAVNLWNGLSSNVTIYDLDDTVPSTVDTFSIKYLGYTPSDPTSNYGRTQPYKKVLLWYEEVSLNEDFDKVEIFINTSPSSPFAGESTDVLIEKVIVHELGHALKLAHPMAQSGLQSVSNARNNYPDNYSVLANMNQGNPNLSSNLTASTPKWHDIINLKNKWGG